MISDEMKAMLLSSAGGFALLSSNTWKLTNLMESASLRLTSLVFV